MIALLRASCLCIAILSLPAVFGAASESTRSKLTKFGADLAGTWEKFPTDAQKNVRTQALTDLVQTFQKEIAKADAPPNLKLAVAYSNLLSNLDKANDLFRTDKMKGERTNYVRMCAITFRREWVQCVDYVNERSTQKCFDMLLDWLEEARQNLTQEKNKDLRQEAYQSANQLFTDILKNAKVPENMDHAVQMDKNIKEAKIRFPTTTPALQAINAPAMTVIEAAARAVKQRAMKR